MTRVVIYHENIAAMRREIQDSFDRHGPIRVPILADPVEGSLPGATTINNYGDGPVIQGNGAQVAYGNQHVTQVCAAGSGLRTQALIEAVTAVLNVLPNIGLSADEHAETSQAAHDVLSEARKEQPDAGRLRKTVAQLKGYLAPLAVSLASGAAHGVGDGAEQATRQAIESLINARW